MVEVIKFELLLDTLLDSIRSAKNLYVDAKNNYFKNWFRYFQSNIVINFTSQWYTYFTGSHYLIACCAISNQGICVIYNNHSKIIIRRVLSVRQRKIGARISFYRCKSKEEEAKKIDTAVRMNTCIRMKLSRKSG